jgi:hypothetical protein
LLLPAGNHILIIKTDSIANIFRNKNIAANPYPYSIPNVFTITGNNATNPSQFYYYLYNMSIRTLDCVGDKVAVIPTVAVAPIISYSGDSLVCTSGINYQWKKDGVDLVGENNQHYKPTEIGNYNCLVTDNTGCQQVSNLLSYPKSNTTNDIIIKPNPANNFIDVVLLTSTNESSQLYIVDAAGKLCLQQYYNSSTNNFNQRININNLAAGVYVLNMIHGSEAFRKKFVVIR